MHTLYPEIALVTASEMKTHFTTHMSMSDRATLSQHKFQLHKLAQYLWEAELITPQDNGNENFDTKNAKLYVDTVKALSDITTKRRIWRIEDAEHCNSIPCALDTRDAVCKVPQKRKRGWNTYI